MKNTEKINGSNIEGIKVCREEENKLEKSNDGEDIKVTNIPIFPNLSE